MFPVDILCTLGIDDTDVGLSVTARAILTGRLRLFQFSLKVHMPASAPNADQSSTAASGMAVNLRTWSTPSQIEAQKKYMKAEGEAVERNAEPLMKGLASHIIKDWQKAQEAKDAIEQKMLVDARQREGVYEADILARISKRGGTKRYFPLTSHKCQTLVAWIQDVLSGTSHDDKMWRLQPSPEVEMPEEVQQSIADETMMQFMAIWEAGGQVDPALARQAASELKDMVDAETREEAKRRARKLERHVDDFLRKGNFYPALNEVIDDISSGRAAFLKGPTPMYKAMIKFETSDGQVKRVVENELVPTFRRVSQFDMYPAPESRDINDRFLIERMRLTPAELMQCQDAPGFDNPSIQYVLAHREFSNRDVDIDNQRDQVEARYDSVAFNDDSVEILDYWGTVPGYMLAEWGMKNIESWTDEYPVNCWVSTRSKTVIRAVINPHPLGNRPYFKTSFEKIPGAFWGQSLPARLATVQAAYCATHREMINNAAVSAQPGIIYNDVSRLSPGQNPGQHFPGKVYLGQGGRHGDRTKLIDQFQPAMNTNHFLAMAENYSREADDHSGIPRFQHGNSAVGGAGETASGLSMLMGASAKGVKRVLKNLDDDVIEPAIQEVVWWVQEFSGDPDLIGDHEVHPQGALELLIRETTAMKQQAFLAQVLSNPVTMQLIGAEGITKMLRAAMRNHNFPADSIPEDLPLPMGAQPGAPGGNSDQPGSGPAEASTPQNQGASNG